MSKAKMDAWMRKHGFKLDADGKMIPAVNSPGGWRELAFAPMPKGMLALYPGDRRKGLQAADVPDCSISLPSVKAELLRFMDEAKIKTPEAAVKWRMVFEVASLDACLLEGVTDALARRCTIRAILHLLSRFSTFVKAAEGEISREEIYERLQKIEAQLAETKDQLYRRTTPPGKLAWWQNLLTRFEDEPGKTAGEKWLGVAQMVVMKVEIEEKKPERDRQCDYLTTPMMNHLIEELKTGSKADRIAALAKRLDRSVRREVQKANKRR